jgi:hypothetical protein
VLAAWTEHRSGCSGRRRDLHRSRVPARLSPGQRLCPARWSCAICEKAISAPRQPARRGFTIW